MNGQMQRLTLRSPLRFAWLDRRRYNMQMSAHGDSTQRVTTSAASGDQRHAPFGAVILLVLGAMGIAFAPILAKLAGQGAVGPNASAFWRVTLAVPILLTSLLLLRRFAPRSVSKTIDSEARRPINPLWMLLPGVLFAGDLSSWHIALQYTTAASSTLLANLQAVIVGFVGWLVLKERVSWLFALGAALALGGMVLLVRSNVAQGDDPAHAAAMQPLKGDLLSMLTAVFYASYILSIKHLRSRWGAVQLMTMASCASSVCLLLIVLLTGEPLVGYAPIGWWACIGLAVVPHCLGQGLIAFSLAKLPASFSAVTLLVQPVAAGLWGWVILGERLGGVQIFAGVVVLTGIYLARRGSIGRR